MTDWDDLTAAALLGTARRSVDVARLPGPLGQAAAALGSPDPAVALLDAAALAAPYRRAGTLPAGTLPAGTLPTGTLPTGTVAEPPAPAPAETGPGVGPAAAARLTALLTVPKASGELLGQWLAAAAAAGRHVPADALPALLDAASRDPELAAAAVPALGERGRWLARLRPEWQRVLTAHAGTGAREPGSATGDDGEWEDGEWEHGDSAARRSLFSRLRRTDPDRARELLAASWASESAEDREALVAALRTGLGDADEPLLEAALDDRRKGVRDAALLLLRALPGSAYAARMRDRMAAVVRIERRLLRTRLVVTPPPEFDRADRRDGLATVMPPGTDAQVWRVEQLVLGMPLPLWPGMTGLPVEQLVALPVEDGWRQPLLRAWVIATQVQRDRAWARALLDVGDPPRDSALTEPHRRSELVALLDPADRAHHVAAEVAARGGSVAHSLTPLLAACPAPWPDVLADAVLAWAARRSRHARDWATVEQLRIAGHRLPVTRAAEVTALAARLPDDSPWRADLLAVIDTLTSRHDLLEELR